MPRVSRAASETPLHLISNVEVIRRVRPPKGLSAEQKSEFEKVVREAPADWFSPLHVATMVQHVRHLIAARRVDQAIATAIEDGYVAQLEMLLRAQARETKAILATATALRLTPRATSPRGVSIRRLSTIASPWTRGNEEALPRLDEDEDAD